MLLSDRDVRASTGMSHLVLGSSASRLTKHLFRWYTRAEAQKRFTFFFSSTTLAGGFGGLLASAIGKMDGMQGFRGWRWIFILGVSIQTPLPMLF